MYYCFSHFERWIKETAFYLTYSFWGYLSNRITKKNGRSLFQTAQDFHWCYNGCWLVCMIINHNKEMCCFPSTAWCLRSEGVSSVLLGVSNTDQLLENLGALQVKYLSFHFCTFLPPKKYWYHWTFSNFFTF